MALVYPAAKCTICGTPIGDSECVPMPAFLSAAFDPLYRFSDTVMHKACFHASPSRDDLIARCEEPYAPDREISFLMEVNEVRRGIFACVSHDRGALDRPVVLSLRSSLPPVTAEGLILVHVRASSLAGYRHPAAALRLIPRVRSFASDRTEYELDRADAAWADIRRDRSFFIGVPPECPVTEPHVRAIYREGR